MIVTILLLSGIILVPLFLWFVIWWTSFKYDVFVARQAGPEIKDVIWRTDRIKVKHHRGAYVIIFRGLRVRSPSFDGRFWQQMDMKSKLQRGLVVYMTTDGEIHPLTISSVKDGVALEILSQDNREFIMNQSIEIAQLTMTSRERLQTVGIVAIACLVIGIVVIIGIVYMSEMAQTIPSGGGGSVVSTIQGVVGG